jgi:hypothetical protein
VCRRDDHGREIPAVNVAAATVTARAFLAVPCPKRGLLPMSKIVVFALLWVCASVAPAAASDHVGVAVGALLVSPTQLLPGDMFEAELVIQSATPVGSYSVDIDCDPTRFTIEAVRGGSTLEFSGRPFSNVSACRARLSGFQTFRLDGPTGDLSIARLDLRVADDAPPTPSTTLDLTIVTVTDTGGAPITTLDVDATVSVGSLCGNAALDTGEDCDDGDAAWAPGESCNAQCRELPCGDVDDSGLITATDALFVLRASVGASACVACMCDVDGSGGSAAATDALRLLLVATGFDVSLDCPACS